MRSRVSSRRISPSLAVGLAVLTLGPLAACSPEARPAAVPEPSPAAGPAPAQSAPAARGVDAISVDTGAVTRSSRPASLASTTSGFWDSAQGSQASANALKQTPSARSVSPAAIPGTGTTGRSRTIRRPRQRLQLECHQSSATGRVGGAVRRYSAFQTNYQGHLPNPPGQPYAVNSPQNQAAWVSYDRAHGINARMEVGNEEDVHMTTYHDSNFQPYITAFNAQASSHARSRPQRTGLRASRDQRVLLVDVGLAGNVPEANRQQGGDGRSRRSVAALLQGHRLEQHQGSGSDLGLQPL